MATRIGQKTVVRAAVATQGNVTQMADLLQVSVATVYRYIERWPKVKAALEAERVAFDTTVKETARARLLKAMEHDRWAAILYGLQHYVETAASTDEAAKRLAEGYSEDLERVYGSDES